MNRRRIVADASPDPKGGDLCEARNRGREADHLNHRHVPDRSRGGKKTVEPGSNIRVDRLGCSTKAELEKQIQGYSSRERREASET